MSKICWGILSRGDDVGSKGFEVDEGAAGGEAGFFEKRRIQDEGAAVDERVIGGFKGFARTASDICSGDEFFIHFQIRLKIEGIPDIPALVASEAGEEFLAEGGGVFAGHRLGSGGIVFGIAAGDELQSAGDDGEQGFALEKIEEISIEAGVDLQGVAAVFDDVGIDEAGDAAFAEDGFAELLGEGWRRSRERRIRILISMA